MSKFTGTSNDNNIAGNKSIITKLTETNKWETSADHMNHTNDEYHFDADSDRNGGDASQEKHCDDVDEHDVTTSARRIINHNTSNETNRRNHTHDVPPSPDHTTATTATTTTTTTTTSAYQHPKSTTSSSTTTTTTSNSTDSDSRRRKIRILSKDVIEQIAAGEIVQRTYIAMKELLENSIDAQATQVRITISYGTLHQSNSNTSTTTENQPIQKNSKTKKNTAGCFSFTVTDNGTGISDMDLPLACTRHATSKITSHLDLTSTSQHTTVHHNNHNDKDNSNNTSVSNNTNALSTMTFGFRGEALAAISMVARNVTITSRTAIANTTTTTTVSTTTTTPNHTIAYQMQYRDGQPISSIPMKRVPRSTIGTTIQVQDLFYNTPQRQIQHQEQHHQEYHMILKILQYYAIHYAARGIVLICERKTTTSSTIVVTDLNTTPFIKSNVPKMKTTPDDTWNQQQQQQQVTFNVIGHTIGSQIIPYLLYHTSELYSNTTTTNTANNDGRHEISANTSNDDPTGEWIYKCTGYITSPKYYNTTTTTTTTTTSNPSRKTIKPIPMILFIYNRYIEGGTTIRRSIEDIYLNKYSTISSSSSNKKMMKPPFLYISLHVPNHTIDINVHPTKRDVILLHIDTILQHLVQQIHVTLDKANTVTPTSTTTSRTTAVTSTTISNENSSNGSTMMINTVASTARIPLKTTMTNPYSNPSKRFKSSSTTSTAVESDSNSNIDRSDDDEYMGTESSSTSTTSRRKMIEPKQQPAVLSQQKSVTSSQPKEASTTKATTTAMGKSLIRTTRTTQSGSLEKYFTTKATSNPSHESKKDHPVPCPLHHDPNWKNDASNSEFMMIPGAFAKVAAQCTCSVERLQLKASVPPQVHDSMLQRQQQQQQQLILPSIVGKFNLRLQRKPPTPCDYRSIQQLRKRTIQKCRDEEFEMKLRNAVYVGTISHYRSLIQCHDELLVMNHYECARELFYQIALNQFGGFSMASLSSQTSGTKGGIDIEMIISQYVQLEELLQQHRSHMTSSKDIEDVSPSNLFQLPLKVTDTNQALAKQVTACLIQHADMLYDYYSIQIDTTGIHGKARLTGLPILIEGYEPSSHGLPLFLLRLASEVDYSEEKPCFYGICRELGSYYAQMPSNMSDEEQKAMIQHVFFPSITTLLIPSKDIATSEFISVTSLPKLYKIFERC